MNRHDGCQSYLSSSCCRAPAMLLAVLLLVVHTTVVAQGLAFGNGNLLVNPGFEEGAGGLPEGWTPVAIDGGPDAPLFEWSASGNDSEASVAISTAGSNRGIWQQLVEVEPGTVYRLSGYVAFADIVPPGRCNLQVVFRDRANTILQLVDLAGHDGTRGWELDFPYTMKLRAPAGATVAEVNGFLKGSDLDHFAATGEVS